MAPMLKIIEIALEVKVTDGRFVFLVLGPEVREAREAVS